MHSAVSRQRLCLEEIPSSDSWFNRHLSVPKGANLWFVRALFLKSVSYFHHEEEELVKFCTVLIQPLRRVLNGDSQDPFRMWNKSFVVSETVFCLGWDDTLRGAAGCLSWTLQVLHELRVVLLEGRSGRIYCLNFAVVQRLLPVMWRSCIGDQNLQLHLSKISILTSSGKIQFSFLPALFPSPCLHYCLNPWRTLMFELCLAN